MIDNRLSKEADRLQNMAVPNKDLLYLSAHNAATKKTDVKNVPTTKNGLNAGSAAITVSCQYITLCSI